MLRLSSGHVLGAGALLAATALGLPAGGRAIDLCVTAASVGAFGCVAAGVARHRPARRGLWALFEGAMLALAVASVGLVAAGEQVAGPFETSQLALLPGYLLLFVAVARLLQSVGGNLASALDAGIGTLVVGCLFWSLLLEPNLAGGSLTRSTTLVFIAVDALLLVALFRLALSATGRLPAARLMLGAFALMLASDVVTLGPRMAAHMPERGTIVVVIAAYALAGAGALHPTMRSIPLIDPPLDEPSSRRLTIAVTSAMLAPLAGIAITKLVEGEPDVWAFVAMGSGLGVLVLVRVTLIGRRAEASEQRFRMMFESAGLGISIGRNGMMTETNPAYQHMLGYDGAELASMHYRSISHPDDVHLDIENAAKVASGELRNYSYEKRVLRKDGTSIWVEVTVSLAADGSFGISLIEDITARKKLEDELRQSQKMEAVGKLAGGIAHDFNNLMTAVLGYADILRRELPAGDPNRSAVEVIADSAVRAGELTRQLLAFSRRQVLRLEPTDIGEVVSRFVPILERVLPENIRLDADLDPGVVARVDSAQLEEVLLNLVVNARDALPDGGHVAIAVHANGAAELAVSDDGVGMDEATRGHIFEPFFTTKPKNAGTGLGLAMVDGIVAQIGGEIEVETAPGEGATFRIRLPLSGGPVAERPPGPAASAAAGHGRVLLTEDEDVVRRVTVHLLGAAGYDVVAAASGEEALALLAAGEVVDVLVTDMVMTGMSGRELAQRVRESVPDMPVLFISGYTDDVLGGALGPDVLLTKPFSPAELTRAIERVRVAVPVG